MSEQLPTEITRGNRLLTAAEFHRLADVPPEVEWFANITNPHTRRAYENAVRDFMGFAGIRRPEEFRIVTRSHIIKWRADRMFILLPAEALVQQWLKTLADFPPRQRPEHWTVGDVLEKLQRNANAL